MWSYSSEQFAKQWRFLIDKDFNKSAGRPYEYAENGLQGWGDELVNIPFPPNEHAPYTPKSAAFSDDGKYLAISANFEVHVYDLKTFKREHVLVGHISEVDNIAFRPGKSSQLISAAMNNYGGTKIADPQIIIWDLSTHSFNVSAMPAFIERFARNAANSVLADMKAMPDATGVSASDQKDLAKTLERPIWELVARRGVTNNTKLSGRLIGGFQSVESNPSGDAFLYMPGKRPKSNGDDDWEVRLYSIDQQKDIAVLSGHRDSIVWAGFNRNGSLIGTASWDQTFRIWDAKTGAQLFLFKTEQQNWTAEFSPDGKYFAGTSGDSKLHVWNLSDGSKSRTFEIGKEWYRALSWHPDGELIALGGGEHGSLYVYDVREDEIIQHRELSSKAMKLPDNLKDKDVSRSYLVVSNVQYVDQGRKIVFFTSGDGSPEVYDVEKGLKWRFARAGTMNSPEDDSEVTSFGGYGVVVYENHEEKKILIASLDGDATRLWSVPMGS